MLSKSTIRQKIQRLSIVLLVFVLVAHVKPANSYLYLGAGGEASLLLKFFFYNKGPIEPNLAELFHRLSACDPDRRKFWRDKGKETFCMPMGASSIDFSRSLIQEYYDIWDEEVGYLTFRGDQEITDEKIAALTGFFNDVCSHFDRIDPTLIKGWERNENNTDVSSINSSDIDNAYFWQELRKAGWFFGCTIRGSTIKPPQIEHSTVKLIFSQKKREVFSISIDVELGEN